jgi:hypothetical protein
VSAAFEQLLGDGEGPKIHAVKPVTGNVKVAREGTLVVLQIGNSTIRMRHGDAMRIGQWLMAKGSEAKFLAGDKNRLQVERK